ncbi:sensor domain-containing protein [Nocardia sp. NEAU-G5]|uniref:Sensor domain-containing protein n=1 Tax=Nocardia albiluteola TaxID=2842303 RepID=A0ABS6BCQ0_9NOCA|nr:sensor domain-containing protein [Nocardia albiluteola]MBU3068064.1 sensor domain-containing protein [Nocardia albiluteola]
MTIIRRLGLDFAYTFLGLPLALISFSLLVSLFAASIGTAVIFIGIPLLALTLLLARGFADIERVRLQQLTGRAAPRPRYAEAPEGAGWFRQITSPIRQGQSWLDLLYAVVNLPIAIVTFVLPILWWAITLGGLTYWFWGRFIPLGDSHDIVIETIMGSDTAHNRTVFYTIVGAVALLTVYTVQRGSAALQAAFAQTLLTRLAVMQGRIQDLTTTSRAAAVSAEAT